MPKFPSGFAERAPRVFFEIWFQWRDYDLFTGRENRKDRSKSNFPAFLPLTLPSPARGEVLEEEVILRSIQEKEHEQMYPVIPIDTAVCATQFVAAVFTIVTALVGLLFTTRG